MGRLIVVGRQNKSDLVNLLLEVFVIEFFALNYIFIGITSIIINNYNRFKFSGIYYYYEDTL